MGGHVAPVERPGPALITERVLAEEWDLAPKTLANWRSQRTGPPYIKLRGSIRYNRRAVAEWLGEREVSPQGAA